MTGYIHRPGYDYPYVHPTADELERAMASIDPANPGEFGNILKRSGLLTAGAAKLIRDGGLFPEVESQDKGKRRGVFVGFGPLMVAMIRVAARRPEIGRVGLDAALRDISDLAVTNVPEAHQPEKRREMQEMAALALNAFDLLTGGTDEWT